MDSCGFPPKSIFWTTLKSITVSGPAGPASVSHARSKGLLESNRQDCLSPFSRILSIYFTEFPAPISLAEDAHHMALSHSANGKSAPIEVYDSGPGDTPTVGYLAEQAFSCTRGALFPKVGNSDKH